MQAVSSQSKNVKFPAEKRLPIARQIMGQAWPNFIAKMIAMAMMIADTVIAGAYGTQDLAAVAIGSSFYVSVIMLMMGILQSVGPIVAYHVGAKERSLIAPALQQGLWLSLFLALPGVVLLHNPEVFLRWALVPEATIQRAAEYMATMAWGLPALLMYRTFNELNNALGKPRVLMGVSVVVTLVHIPLAWALAHGVLGFAPLGGVGCGVSTSVVNWVALAACLAYVAWDSDYTRYQLFHRLHLPKLGALAQQLKLGVPMGLSTFIDISSFTLIAILVARLGDEVVAGHRVMSNFTGLIYMLPLSIAIATTVFVGHSNGAQNAVRSRLVAQTGVLLAFALSVAVGVALWVFRESLIAWSTPDLRVQQVALGLVVYLCAYQFFDALQTVASYALRGYKVTLLPMVIHTACFWGVGLIGGYMLAFEVPWRAAQPSVIGFWEGCVLATALATVLFFVLLARVSAARAESTQSPHRDSPSPA